MFGYNNDDVNQALQMTGSQYAVPAQQPAAPPPQAAVPAVQAPSMADNVAKAQQMTSMAQTASSFGAQPAEDEGKKHQQEAFSKIGSVLGAIGNFYTGNWVGAANSAKGLMGGQK